MPDTGLRGPRRAADGGADGPRLLDGSAEPAPSDGPADAGPSDAGGARGPDEAGIAPNGGSAAAAADSAAHSDPPADQGPATDPDPATDAAPDPPADPGPATDADPDPPADPGPATDAAPDPPAAGSAAPSAADQGCESVAADPGPATDAASAPSAGNLDPSPPPPSPWTDPSPAFPPAAGSSGAGIGRGMLVAAVAAAFVAGIAAAGAGAALLGDPDSTTNDELAAMIGGLRDDLAPLREAAGPPPPPAQRSPSAAAEALSDDDPSKGDPDAPITIVEFSDFQCPFCGRFYEQTLPLVERDYIETGKARLVFRDMPLDIHPQAPPAHIAAECADEQGRFWEYHDVLFDRQGEWSRLSGAALDGALAGYAAGLGLDDSFAECVRSPEAEREMRLDYEQALAMGLTGTPTFLIGGNGHDFVAISGAQPYSTFASILDGML